ncbi:UTP--glucose-1-phosphate uridylyltransferase 3, chloroplastic [Ricinus communis]|uniref:UTP--glucose-1-phosphate uridylyltransferase 3, chloroplastic n=1 Tax=Ricinus communis TaxID=3988 RepID=UPI00201A57F2|nr:UTP--glucose-1-phosphate uridylyltransferase 3, chloroplastic [Ricinus communis]
MAMANTAPPTNTFYFLHHKTSTITTAFLSTPTSKTLPFTFFSSKPPLLLSSSSSSPRSSFHITRVTTVPLDYAPPAPDSDNNNNSNNDNDISSFHQEISRLKSLRSNLVDSKSFNQKLSVLDSDSRVVSFFNSHHKNRVSRVFNSLNVGFHELYLLKCLVAAGQQHVISLGIEFSEMETARSTLKSAFYALVDMIERFDFGNGLHKSNNLDLKEEEFEDLRKLLKTLDEIERFYDCIGGIIGYQIMVLELLAQSTSDKQTTNWSRHIQESMECQFLEIHTPNVVDLSENAEYACQAALWGVEGLPDLGEIYPLGGSADRLGLVDPDTGECLPAAMLPYCGRTLLEGLVRDLQAREFLYFKLYGKQSITPVAIMTSSAKNNHKHITSLCERLCWFGRGRSSFKLFEQPLVPAVDAEDGQWLITKPFAPVSKPGGHGVIWKLASDKGVFEWFYAHGRKGATVRQVSNVVAATDLTLLALAGIGLRHGKKLGFASCKRNSGATEGINVLVEKKTLDGKWAYGVSCIEYTEFEKFGIPSGSCSSNSLQAEFPANTNILYVDLSSVESIASSNSEKSLPGMVLNTKKPVMYMDHFGNRHSISGGRLECTMQNIADNFLNTYFSRCYQGVEDNLDTFIVYNERRRVTSSAKKKRRHGDNSLHQTPDGSLLDILRNACDLLSHCDIELPEIEGNNRYVDSGPPFLIFLHPALGPLWEVTRQKFSGGSISRGSELQVEVAEFLWRNVELDGSLIVIAENAMGSTRIHSNGEPILQYGHRCGRCKLQNIKVLNQGINWSSGENVYWKHNVQRFEAFKIILHGNAEFEASNVTIEGNQVFEVPDGYKMKITSGYSGLDVQLNTIEPIMMDSGSWFWNYKLNGTHILLELVEL